VLFRCLLLSIMLFGATSSGPPQVASSSHARRGQPSGTDSKWIEDKFLVHEEEPYLSDSGYLVLVYAVTNKSGSDVKIDFVKKPEITLDAHEPTRVFLKLKHSRSYVHVTPEDNRIFFPKELLAADLRVIFKIVVGERHDAKTSWFSSQTANDKLRNAIREEVGDTESIVVFIPDRRLKIEFPIPKARGR
jgi:hypothetical protein